VRNHRPTVHRPTSPLERLPRQPVEERERRVIEADGRCFDRQDRLTTGTPGLEARL
jgi:hypothetical protein